MPFFPTDCARAPVDSELRALGWAEPEYVLRHVGELVVVVVLEVLGRSLLY